MFEERFVRQAHAPPHLFRAGALYCITAKTLDGEHHLHDPARRDETIKALRFASTKRDWSLIAWVVLSNHYHCILRAPEPGAEALSGLLNSVHSFTARKWNREDNRQGRVVWYQFWDTCLTHETSFFARLNYIHYNPVKHGLTARPEDYPHSSYRLWCESEEIDLQAIEDAYPWDLLDLE